MGRRRKVIRGTGTGLFRKPESTPIVIVDFDEIMKAVDLLEREELLKLNEAVCVRIKELNARAVRRFSVGDRVAWNSRKMKRRMKGVVEKVLRKNVSVKTEDGCLWKVPGSMLEDDE